MANTNNLLRLKYLVPFLLNGLLLLIVNLVGNQTNGSPYGLAVYVLIILFAGLIANLILLFAFIFNKDYKTAALYFLASAAIIIFFFLLQINYL